MGTQQDSKYYDDIYSVVKTYAESYRSCKLLPLWALAMQIIDRLPQQNLSILDIGCGTGQFAEFIMRHTKIDYTGIDFSEKAIDIAKSRKIKGKQTPLFIQTDAFAPFIWEKKFTVYTIFETLEHIDQDTEIIARIPNGAMIILSVPTFDDPAHVRHFKSFGEVLKRYGPFIGSETSPKDRKAVETIRAWFIMYGVRNSTPRPIEIQL